jgi:hypothetical protein
MIYLDYNISLARTRWYIKLPPNRQLKIFYFDAVKPFMFYENIALRKFEYCLTPIVIYNFRTC